MRTEGRRESENIEDRRGIRPRQMAIGGGIGGIVILLVALFFGVDLQQLLGPGGPGQGPEAGPGAVERLPVNPEEEPLRKFVAVVLADTEDVWNDLFPRQLGRKYREPRLVLYSHSVESACGFASAAMGPFYCPPDERVYIDLSFFKELKSKFQAPGDFAIAYVVAHEIGHHVQKQLGYTDRVHGMKGKVSEREFNQLSVRLELQADFLAGVFAHHAQRAKNVLEPGDLEEAIRAAAAVGDDRLQKQAKGYIVPDSFTHGSSEQRIRWFKRGFQSGKVKDGDTFGVSYGEL